MTYFKKNSKEVDGWRTSNLFSFFLQGLFSFPSFLSSYGLVIFTSFCFYLYPKHHVYL